MKQTEIIDGVKYILDDDGQHRDMKTGRIVSPFFDSPSYMDDPELSRPNPTGHNDAPAIGTKRTSSQPWKFDPSWRGIFGAKNDQGVKTHEGLLGGILGGAKDLFNDPSRMALISGGLRMADPNSYYDKQGFYSPWGGINAGLGTGIKTYKSLSEPTKLGFKKQEEIKQANALALQADKAKHLVPTTAKDANKRLRYSSGKNIGDLVYPNLTVAPEKMDLNQIFNAELKLNKDFATETSTERDQMDAYRRIEAIYQDPTKPFFDESGSLPTSAGYKDGEVFDLDHAGAADLALIFNYMKMLDPRSVVRESEFALAASTGNIPARVMAMYDRVVKGGTLDATMRQDLVRQSRNQFDSAVKSMARKHKDYTKRGEKYGSMGVNASRALEFSSYEPLIDTRHFNPLVTVDDNNKVDPNNRLNLKRKPR